MAKTKQVKCTAKKVLYDVTVEADLSAMCWFSRSASMEQRAKDLERAVKDFKEFLRDHRSQDMISLDVQRRVELVCSACGNLWEIDETDESNPYCMHCGAIVEQNNG